MQAAGILNVALSEQISQSKRIHTIIHLKYFYLDFRIRGKVLQDEREIANGNGIELCLPHIESIGRTRVSIQLHTFFSIPAVH